MFTEEWDAGRKSGRSKCEIRRIYDSSYSNFMVAYATVYSFTFSGLWCDPECRRTRINDTEKSPIIHCLAPLGALEIRWTDNGE